MSSLLADLPFSPAAERNAPHLLAVLNACLPAHAKVLEIASGTGQHAAHFARARPDWQWQPTEARADLLPAIAQRCSGLANVSVPEAMDITSPPWAGGLDEGGSGADLWFFKPFDAIFCANLLHISPWPTCEALMRSAATLLSPSGLLIVYGPFLVAGEAVADSNQAFDRDLRSRNPAWGLRSLSAVEDIAEAAGLGLFRRATMPAHNLTLVFARAGVASHSSRPTDA